MKQLILALSLLFYGYHAAAQEVRDSVRIYFRQGKTELDLSMPGNRTALNRIADSLRSSYADSVFQLRRILVVGGASPEGSVSLNKRLSVERAESLFNYLSRYGALPDSLKTTRFLGRDWNGLIHLVERDRDIPYKGETLDLLREIARGDAPEDAYLNRLRQLRGGVPYHYMYKNLFPELRASRLLLWYKKALNPVVPLPEPKPLVLRTDTIRIHDTIYIQTPAERRPFYMAVKTNMLYDLALVPNIGVEFYLGKRWSVAADWMYAWWKTDRRHWYWRTYGGDVEIRHWLGKKAKEKPLTGHHVGLYGGIVTYDFELGGRGYLGDKWSYGGGVSYGYSCPIAPRLNLDFTLGIGYLGGEYKEYLPIDDCYVWQATKRRHWFGPTKLEVSLVWLIGHGNQNKGKGGKR